MDLETGRFRVGETWSYHTRPGEEGSTLTIVKVEAYPNRGTVVHVSLRGLRVRSPHAPNGITSTISHMPFSEDALSRSVTARNATHDALPDFLEGYREWRSAFDDGRAGVFSTTVAEAVEFIERSLDR